MISVEKALEIILDSVRELDGGKVEILQAGGRVLYKDIISDINIPPLDNSAMDGYAIIACDTENASKTSPSVLPITGEIQAGGDFENTIVVKGKAVRIMTGAPVPAGADSVVQFEDTEEAGDVVKIFRKVKKGENIRLAGEDVKSGDTVFLKGRILKSADIGILASLNLTEVEVFRLPSISLISTGDEIAEVGDVIKPGQIRNSNAYSILAELKKNNLPAVYLGIVRDDKDAARKVFTKALGSDIVITTGGVSMGKYDYVREIMSELGVEIKIDSIKMKPGKPLAFGTKGASLFFGLPGNPVSAMVSFSQFVRPALFKMSGAIKFSKPEVFAILEEDIKKKAGRRHFMRGVFSIKDGMFYVKTTGNQGSGILKSMSEANCLMIFPEENEILKKGDKIIIQLTEHGEI